MSTYDQPAAVTAFVVCIGLALPWLAGCSSAPTVGERMAAASGEASELAERWNQGQAMALKGEKLVEDGKDDVKDGERTVDKGKDKISAGERDIGRGKKLIEQGRAQMVDAETAFRERYPELYRDMLLQR